MFIVILGDGYFYFCYLIIFGTSYYFHACAIFSNRYSPVCFFSWLLSRCFLLVALPLKSSRMITRSSDYSQFEFLTPNLYNSGSH